MTNLSKILIAFVIVLSTIIFLQQCEKNDDVLSNVVSAKDTVFKEMIKGVLADYNKSIVVENQNQFKILAQQNDTLKKLVAKLKNTSSVTIIKERVYIEKDTIPFLDTIPCNFKPIPAIKKDANYSFFGKVTNKGLSIDSLSIPNKQSIVMGEKKVNFWGKKEQGIYIVNSNPLVKTEAIQNIILVEEKKWYQRPSTWFGIGTIAGLITSFTLLK